MASHKKRAMAIGAERAIEYGSESDEETDAVKRNSTRQHELAQEVKVDAATEELLLADMRKLKSGKMKILTRDEADRRRTDIVKKLRDLCPTR